jgi:mono/diheme cytochrome c family protein
MRRAAVQRAALLLGAALLAIAAMFAWLVNRDRTRTGTAPAAGAARFEEHCASCHVAEGLRLRIGGADAARRRELERFLQRHGDAPRADDRLILDYLTRD